MNNWKIFESVTKDYEERFLTDSPQIIENDWWKALQFFFSRVFYQGRRDEVSEEVERRVIKATSGYFREEAIRDSEFERLKGGNWKEFRDELRKTIGRGKMGKPLDIDLTISTMEFVSQLRDKNIVNDSVRKIKLGKILVHSKELQRIRGVGPKISSLYLRDIVSLFKLTNYLRNDQDFEVVMPVDTWIRKIAKSLRIVEEDSKDNEIVRTVIQRCKENNISPIQINQGIWYIGTQSFEPCFNRVLKAVEEIKTGKTKAASNKLAECVGILEVLESLEEDKDERSRLENYRRRILSQV